MITVFRGDRRVIAWQTQEEAIAWCRRNQLSTDWTNDYRLESTNGQTPTGDSD